LRWRAQRNRSNRTIKTDLSRHLKGRPVSSLASKALAPAILPCDSGHREFTAGARSDFGAAVFSLSAGFHKILGRKTLFISMDKEGPILLSQLEHDRAYDRNRAGVKDGVALPLAPFAVGALTGPENCANSAAMPPHGGSINIRQNRSLHAIQRHCPKDRVVN
jgi:hypothetical protein